MISQKLLNLLFIIIIIILLPNPSELIKVSRLAFCRNSKDCNDPLIMDFKTEKELNIIYPGAKNSINSVNLQLKEAVNVLNSNSNK